MDVTIRDATQTDMPELLELNAQIQRQHGEEFPKDFVSQPDAMGLRSFFTRLIKDDKQILYIAEAKGQAAGYLWCEIQRFDASLFRPARAQLYIQHVCVDQNQRRLGIASALFQAVDDHAKSLGIAKVGLDTWSGNEAAQSFFDRQGFEIQQIRYAKKIERTTTP